ncbi:autotransporter domain-containing protein [Pokkaliibacter sp. MBI-7]|uniref:autotransporter domain-containing protein n=1 Tax=Pokkaliibacter sp. MBI-7 TaxID=3040600 RepID=UPI0024489FB7|nr:autotransporter domain-containing protein [Pokkaliibacter sp. MBI-7]MDH2433839.1 autotransporter domain-containing protein [Pokkaliibacter sp. MBI-7]
MRLFKLSMLCASLLSVPVAEAANYSNTIFFGDSLTDSGYYDAIIQAINPDAGKFTSNPGNVWSEDFASRFGYSATPSNQGGTNYAAGGARVSGTPGVGSYPATTAPPVTTQITTYLSSTGGKADPNALYTVWAGANDLFVAATMDLASATSYLQTTIAEQVTAIATLKAAGARYIIVPTIPDIGKTPFGLSSGTTASAQLSLLSSTYTSTLLSGLKSAGIAVIPVDVTTLVAEVTANPGLYGFTNVTDPLCGSTSSLICSAGVNYTAGDELNYLYADSVHPTSAAHQILSDYAYSIIVAPEFVAEVGKQSIEQNRQWQQTLLSQARTASLGTIGSSQWWLNATGGHSNDEGEFAGDQSPYSISTGVDKRLDDQRTLGFALHYALADSDLAQGDAQRDTLGFALYGGYQRGNWYLNGQVAVSHSDYDLSRKIDLGIAKRTMDANTKSISFMAGAETGYDFHYGRLHYGPVASLTLQRINLDGYQEHSADGEAASLKFDEQQFDSGLGSVGLQFNWQGDRWQPYARVSWFKEFAQGDDDVTAALVTLPAYKFTLPISERDDSFGQVMAGTQARLGDKLNLDLQASRLVSYTNTSATSISATLRYAF